jgi:NAD+ kinase
LARRPRVQIVGDEQKGEVRQVLGELQPWLEKRADIVGVQLGRDSSLEDIDADFVVVFGGDGTILSTARRMGRTQLPTLGVNLGRLGFLAEFRVEGARTALELALEGRLEEERRLLLECQAPGESEPVLLLNDAVCQRGMQLGLIEISARVGHKSVTTYSGDGLIVATPVGSTAYSLSLGGPILAPGVDALVLTPIAPHALPVRPLVVTATQVIELLVEAPTGEPVGSLVCDGQIKLPVCGGDRILLQKAKNDFRLLTLENRDFYSILRSKFGWAGSPRYTSRGELGEG